MFQGTLNTFTDLTALLIVNYTPPPLSGRGSERFEGGNVDRFHSWPEHSFKVQTPDAEWKCTKSVTGENMS